MPRFNGICARRWRSKPEIAAGRLVQPFSLRLPVKFNYHLVTSPHKAGYDKVTAFRGWILAESAYLREPLANSDEIGRG